MHQDLQTQPEPFSASIGFGIGVGGSVSLLKLSSGLVFDVGFRSGIEVGIWIGIGSSFRILGKLTFG